MPPVNLTRVFGTKQLLDELRELGVKLPQTAMRRALYAGAVPMRDEAKRLVPIRTGALKRSIAVSTKREGKKGAEEYVAYIRIQRKAFKRGNRGKIKLSKKKPGENAYNRGEIYPRNYAHLVEYGTRPHQAGPRSHPGARAKPFMRPAFDSKIGLAEQLIIAKLREQADKVLAKGNAKSRAGRSRRQ